MVLALIIVSSILTYLYAAGTVSRNFKAVSAKRCHKCSTPDRWGDTNCRADHVSAAIFAGLLFPAALPLLLGLYGAGGVFATGQGGTRDERRRARELTEANHKEELAKIQARTTRELEKALED